MNYFLLSGMLAFSSLFALKSYAYHEESFTISSTDQINLHLKHYETKKPNQFNRKHFILFIQGQSDATSIAEHFLIDSLEFLNLNVVSYDVRGQGLSDGPRAHIDNFYDHVDDLTNIIKFTKENFQYEHVHFLTHSTGGLIASLFATLQKSMLSKSSSLTFFAPYFALPDEDLMIFGIDLLSYSLSLTPIKYWQVPEPGGKGNYLKEDGGMNSFTSDLSMYKSYKDHPDKCGRPTFGWVQASIEAQRIIEEEASKLSLPVLMFTATGDQVVSTSEAKKFYYKWKNTSKHNRYVEFPEPNQHGLIYEQEQTRGEMLTSIGKFIDRVTHSSPGERHTSNAKLLANADDAQTKQTSYELKTSSKVGSLVPKINRKKSAAQSMLYPAFLFFIPLAALIYIRRRRI